MKESIEDLLPRYFEGGLSIEERRQVEQWVHKSEEHEKIARQIQMLYLASDTANVIEKVDVEKALDKVHRKIKMNKTKLFFRYLERAAVILLIPFIAITFGRYAMDDASADEMITIHCNPGSTTKVTLPDGTVAHLNSDSRLTYPTRFEKDSRQVELQGEAFFDVTKDEKRHFFVNLKNQTFIEVMGTRFNVEAYDDSEAIVTTLVEGKVRFEFISRNKKNSYSLKPGQRLAYNVADGSLELMRTNCQTETSWKDGMLIFDDTPLREVLQILSKRFCVQFVIKNEKLERHRFTGTFQNNRMEQILQYISIASDLKWKYTDTDIDDSNHSIIEIF